MIHKRRQTNLSEIFTQNFRGTFAAIGNHSRAILEMLQSENKNEPTKSVFNEKLFVNKQSLANEKLKQKFLWLVPQKKKHSNRGQQTKAARNNSLHVIVHNLLGFEFCAEIFDNNLSRAR
jgi:hypothetical protein